ncbi:hypothetical protein [Chromatium okenii]|uniref:hypothetical protein n=1 Tax=Chromatium okenii TaxID=61644 RepID=UPI001907AA86|nr:hypothetical protein [Chromatium okenii]
MLRYFIISCVMLLLIIAPARAETALSFPLLSAHNAQKWSPFHFYAQNMPPEFSIDDLNVLAQVAAVIHRADGGGNVRTS